MGVPSISFPKVFLDSRNGQIKEEALDGKMRPRIYTIWESHFLKNDKNNNVSFFCLSCYTFGKRGKKVKFLGNYLLEPNLISSILFKVNHQSNGCAIILRKEINRFDKFLDLLSANDLALVFMKFLFRLKKKIFRAHQSFTFIYVIRMRQGDC